MIDCKHEELTFWSGGFYVACTKCYAKWVAVTTGGNDTDLDYSRSNVCNTGVRRAITPAADAALGLTNSDLTRP